MADKTPMQTLNENLQESADAQPMSVYCVFCPKWRATGTAAETRAAAEQHRRDEHPETFSKKQKLIRRRRVFSQALTADRQAEIDEERRQRARLLGLELEGG